MSLPIPALRLALPAAGSSGTLHPGR
jgi:hypothetical protein